MNDYNTNMVTVKLLTTSFEMVPRYAIKNEFFIDGKWRRLSNSEVAMFMAILHYVKLSENKSHPGGAFREKDGTPFSLASIETLAYEANQSPKTAIKNKKTLQGIKLVNVIKRGIHQTDKIYIGDPQCVKMREVTKASSKSGEIPEENPKEPLEVDQVPTVVLENELETVAIPKGVKTTPQRCRNYSLFIKSLVRKRVYKRLKPKYIKACIDETPSTSLSVDEKNAPNHPHTGPTRPSDLEVTKTGACDTQGGDVDTGKDRKYDITTLPGEGSQDSLGLAATRYIRDPLHSLYVQINSRFDFGEFKVMVEELTVEADVDCSDALCARVLEAVTEMSRSNGYGKPSSSYIMNPDVIAKALVKCGVAHNDVYKGLFDYKRDYELELVGA